MSKDVDKLNDNTLLRKLKHYGVKDANLTLLQNYLPNRKQYVKFDYIKLDLLIITTGVPHRSILGHYYSLFT